MLVLTRKAKEQILIGDQIAITVTRIKGNTVQLGIEAPREIKVLRSELADGASHEIGEAEDLCFAWPVDLEVAPPELRDFDVQVELTAKAPARTSRAATLAFTPIA